MDNKKNDEKNKCWECDNKMVEKQVDYILYGVAIGTFPALVCDHCNETYFSEETSRKITEITKQKGLWGLQARTKVGQAGNTLDIRLPKKIIEFTHLSKGAEVTITPENKNKIVITL
ncbi:YgiT-type zinc finger protein [Candidatus Woesearchaeota archaeon]|nr:YgiT-type zinc finger protein [Candidatus Woesearchaeota archaeon]